MNPFDNNDISTYTVETFGKSVRQRRKQLNLSGRELAKRIGVSPIYLSDIERSIRPVPASPKIDIDYISALENELQLTASQRKNFRNMAVCSNLKADRLLDNYFLNNPHALKFFVTAIDENWEDTKWEMLLTLIDKKWVRKRRSNERLF